MIDIKKFIICFFVFHSFIGYSQFYTPAQIITINSTRAAFEGDMYLDTNNNDYYIGLTNGALASIGDTVLTYFGKLGDSIYYVSEIGDTTFVNIEGSDHDWYEVGTLTYPTNINDNIFTEGNVGIGIDNPDTKLHVRGSGPVLATFEDIAVNGNDAGIKVLGKRNGTIHTDVAYIDLSNFDDNEGAGEEFIMGRIGGGLDDVSGKTGILKFSTNDGTSLNEAMRINKIGNTGIGETDPLNRLHVTDLSANDPLRVEGFNIAQANDTSILVTNPADGTVRYLDLDSLTVSTSPVSSTLTTVTQTSNDQVLVTANDLQFNYIAGKKYRFKIYLVYESSNTDNGFDIAMNAVTGNIWYDLKGSRNGTGSYDIYTGFNSTATHVIDRSAAANTPLVATIEGTIHATGNGTFSFQYACEINGRTIIIQPNSLIEVEVIK